MNDIPHPKTMYEPKRILRALKSLIFGPVALRRRTMLEINRIISNTLGGHYIGDDYKLWLEDVDFVSTFKSLSPHNYYSMERKYSLKELTRSTNLLNGKVAECGSYVGVSAWFIANEIKGTDFYLFDSFEGLPPPSYKDQSPEGVQQWQKGDLCVTENVLKRNLRSFKNIHIMKGWIPERFCEVADQQFRLVHIDVDLYEPTRDSLSFFYGRMVPGGIIVLDDYGFKNCPGAFRAANEFMSDKPESIVHLTTGQGVIIRRY